MPELRDLYQDVILDHGRRPRNFRLPERPSHQAEGFNPLCGDRIQLSLEVEDGRIREAGFQGSGCAISTASASMMTEAVKGRSLEDVEALFRRFHALVAGPEEDHPQDRGALGKLAVFSGVREYPTRVKCAVLPWHTLRSALAGAREPVTTE
ncbi:MAG: Fe-S cluster assembly sulfur transfer protein SufU [Acidobacteriota bacterium]